MNEFALTNDTKSFSSPNASHHQTSLGLKLSFYNTEHKLYKYVSLLQNKHRHNNIILIIQHRITRKSTGSLANKCSSAVLPRLIAPPRHPEPCGEEVLPLSQVRGKREKKRQLGNILEVFGNTTFSPPVFGLTCRLQSELGLERGFMEDWSEGDTTRATVLEIAHKRWM